jgi:Na+-transporting methylmalonyl-CoA/oxaloacetate decarboxylase gamma subunit
MAEGTTSFTKIMLGVGCGIVLAVVLLMAVCSACVGNVAMKMDQQKREKRDALNAIDIKDLDASRTSGYATITGRACNNGSTKVDFVKIQAEFLDESGKVIDTDFTYAASSDGIEPGTCKGFSIMQKSAGWERYRVHVMSE